MKVYYSDSRYEGCYYVRCLLPMHAGGWDGDRVSLRGARKDEVLASRAMMASDIIVMQRPFEGPRMTVLNLLKEAGKKIVFDNDDTYKVNDAMKLGKYFNQVSDNIDWFIERADLVTTTTEFLAKEYRKLNPNVVVLKNCINPKAWGKPIRNKGHKFRIGITGSVGSTNDFKHIKEDLKRLSDNPDIQLVLFSLPPKESEEYKYYDTSFWDSLNIEWHHNVRIWDYPDKLNSLKLDLMLIPREDNYFNRCKSNLKFLEASMLEIPVLAQAFEDGKSPYQSDPYINLVYGNWYEETISACENLKELRARAKKAKKYVLENYDINKNIHLWEKAYAKLY